MKIGKFEIDVEPPFTPLEKAVMVTAGIPAFFAGYVWAHHWIEQLIAWLAP